MEEWVNYIWGFFSMEDRVEAARGNTAWPSMADEALTRVLKDPFNSLLVSAFAAKYKISHPEDIRRILLRACISKAKKESKSLDLTVQEYEQMWSTYAE